MTGLGFLLDRSTIVVLAIGGALMALAGSLLHARAAGAHGKFARLLLRCGYAITWSSVLLFIVAGFMSNR